MPVKLLLKYKIHSFISQGTLITQGRRWKYKVHSDLGSIRQRFLANMLQPCGSRVKGQFGLCRPVGHWFLYWDRWHRCRLAPAAMQIPVPEALDGDQELRRIGHWQPSVVSLHRETLDLIQPPCGEDSFPFHQATTFFHPLKAFKAGFTSPFHVAVLRLLSGGKTCGDTHPLWQGTREGEKYVWSVQGAIKTHCCCSQRGQAVTALHTGPTATVYTLH